MRTIKHKPVKRSDFYKTADGKAQTTKKCCDRCGSGTFMAEHKDRFYCGKCGMTVWKKNDDKKEVKS